MVASGEEFPYDLSGHFWAELERDEQGGRWQFTIRDYQNHVMLQGIAVSEVQAARFVRSWDAVVTAQFEGNGDPSLD